VRKAFGAAVAVENLDLRIESGEFVSLLGPSGCGKTTSLRMLAGLEVPTSGTIRIGDRVVNDIAPGKRDIAMVFQSYALYPHMTVAQNIEYPLKKRRIPKPERGPKVAEVAKLLHLGDYLARKPRQLSGGQQQRVALGRALVRDPAVFLLDEPLSNLDAKLRAHMRAELIELHQRIGRTMVYVTHDQLEAMTMSDRIAVLANGRLQQLDTPAMIYRQPANRFVAGFIGTPSMNLVEGRLEHGAFVAGEWRLPVEGLALDRPTGAVTLGIRPEDILIDPAGQPARVKLVEPTGHEAIVQLEIAGHQLTGRVGAEIALRAGEPLGLSFRTANLHLFAGEDGRRLNKGT
jgi:ABC-type sugar transport system ATPase subunit